MVSATNCGAYKTYTDVRRQLLTRRLLSLYVVYVTKNRFLEKSVDCVQLPYIVHVRS